KRRSSLPDITKFQDMYNNIEPRKSIVPFTDYMTDKELQKIESRVVTKDNQSQPQKSTSSFNDIQINLSGTNKNSSKVGVYKGLTNTNTNIVSNRFNNNIKNNSNNDLHEFHTNYISVSKKRNNIHKVMNEI